MNCFKGRIVPAVLLLGPVLTFIAPVQAQNSVTASARPGISVLDSTKEQDGLVGSVRRVKTETAKIEVKDGRAIEGTPQLVEVTTYGIKGNRIENTSYPIAGSLVGKEEYKYDERGNITEMTLRDERGAIVSREAYTYEFDKFGNWTKMVTNLVVFENGELKREPVEVTYRTVTYYFDDSVAKAVDGEKSAPVATQPVAANAASVPKPVSRETEVTGIFSVNYGEAPRSSTAPAPGSSTGPSSSPKISENPPPLTLAKPEPPKLVAAEPVATNSSAVAAKSPEPATTNSSAPATTNSSAAVAKSPAPAPPNPAMDLYQSGRSRFEAGDVKGAVDLYLQAIKLEPNSAEVFLNLGHAYLELEKNGDAAKAFKQSLKLNPDQAETYYGLGVACFRSNRNKEAADAFKKAAQLNPAMAKAHYGLSLAYGELGETSKLLDEYRILERLDKTLANKVAQTFPEHDYSCRLVRGCP